MDLLDAGGCRLSGHLRITSARILDLQRVDEQLLAARHLHVEARRRRAQASGKPSMRSPRRTRGSARRAGTSSISSSRALDRRALGDELERERERVGHDLAQVTDLHLDRSSTRRPSRVLGGDLHDGLGDRELVHQQIRGSGSPTSWSITRRPPKAVSTSTIPGGSVAHLADLGRAARGPASRAARPAPRRRASGATNATNTPSLATYIGSMPEQLAGAGHGRRAPARRPRAPTIADARRARQLVEHGGDAAARRVAHAAQAGAGGVEQRVDRGPQRARVGDDRRRRARTRRARA